MSRSAALRRRLNVDHGSLNLTIDPAMAQQLDLSDGAEVEVSIENGCLIVAPLRPKILAPVSDAAARAERERKIAEATEHAMEKHHDLLILLAK
jgi:antitoxin component of MazEF toxin-antitoxin module